MRKCLIYVEKRHLKNAGGPLGYNYNLKQGLDDLGIENIFFLNNLPSAVESKAQSIKNNKKSFANKLFYTSFFRSLYGGFKHMFEYLSVIFKKGDKRVDFNDYDIIHFHSCLDLYRNQKQLKNYKGIVLLTTHSPIMPSFELKRDYEKWTRFLFFYIYFWGKHIDISALKRADYIISPCENAMDSYKKYSRKYETIVKDKMIYLLTGCINQNGLETTDEEIRLKYCISNAFFNISYLGRHNKVKGYDILKKYAIKLNSYDKNIRFIIGGKIGPCKPPKIDTWEEVGFTKDALGIMKCCDVYVSCNTDTYFDLATIQALSVGTIVVTTRVGGNLFFEKNSVPGVYLFDNYDEFLSIVMTIKAMTLNERNNLKASILKAYGELFNFKSFALNYAKIVNELPLAEWVNKTKQ